MRAILVILAATATAAPALAQKPDADPARAAWRAQSGAVCVAELGTAEGLTPGDRQAICGCAFDRYLDGRPSGALPSLDPARLRSLLGGQLLACTTQEQPERAPAVARWLVARAPVTAVPVAEPPPELGGKPPADEGDLADPREPDNGPGLGGWWDALRRRIADSGLPIWAWIPIVVFSLLVLRGLGRRRDRPDLMGPPRR